VHEHDEAPGQTSAQDERAIQRAAPQAPVQALQRAVGNRAMGQMLQRMETNEAVELLEKATAPGVVGAERVVANTLTNYARDPIGRDKLAIEYEKKVEKPLAPSAEPVPPGFFKGISGEKYPEPKQGG
jgi:hypothetical protein